MEDAAVIWKKGWQTSEETFDLPARSRFGEGRAPPSNTNMRASTLGND
jgi:hypothetical protein